MKFGNKDNKYIILKNGNNYGFIFGTVQYADTAYRP